ncbi:MAG: thiamine phosphate synthase [Kiritimatiellia bacterium]|jgi:thiamine-phosphate pyrophosphorylase
MIAKEALAVYLVTDDPSRYAGDFLDNVAAAVGGGVTVVQYRDTESSDRVKYTRALRLQNLLRARGVPLIMDNDVDLALAIGADGVHLGQSDLPADVVRRLVGPSMTIGLSITCEADATTVSPESVDYVGIGPVYDATKTKADAAPEMGLEGFAAIRKLLADYPAVAIGGVTLERARGIVDAGADGLAVVSAFSRSATPADVARGFAACFRSPVP